jgi:hypothetical protein
VFHLATGGASEADDPHDVTTVNKSYVVKGAGPRCERDNSQFVVLKPIVNPHQPSILIKPICQPKQNAVLRKVASILLWIELDLHDLL